MVVGLLVCSEDYKAEITHKIKEEEKKKTQSPGQFSASYSFRGDTIPLPYSDSSSYSLDGGCSRGLRERGGTGIR